jgi:drug/metabolite transporter (DMT)-like permease
MQVMDFLAWRFGIAALIMIALRPTCLRRMTHTGRWRAAVLGLALGLGYITQTFGLRYASASVSGFITGMFVVLTPVISWLVLHRKINRNTWLAVLLATFGLALLSLHGWSIGQGELLTLGCAVFYALHVVGLGEWSAQHETYGLTFLQLAFVAAICLAASTPGGIAVPPDAGVWIAVGLTAVLATAVAFFVQTWAQALVSPTRAAVVMTMEPVFAGIFAVLLGGDRLTIRTLAGAACVLAGMYLVQLRAASKAVRAEN